MDSAVLVSLGHTMNHLVLLALPPHSQPGTMCEKNCKWSKFQLSGVELAVSALKGLFPITMASNAKQKSR